MLVHSKLLFGLIVWLLFGMACTFSFKVPSQKTALENQVMGSYQEMDDDLVLISSVRDPKSKSLGLQEKAKLARQNQLFNQDDIDELKSLEVLGEAKDGTIAVLPARIGKSEQAKKRQMKLARLLVDEENGDRKVIWQSTIAGNDNLTQSDLPNVKKTFANKKKETASIGHWYQEQNGKWVQKTAAGQ